MSSRPASSVKDKSAIKKKNNNVMYEQHLSVFIKFCGVSNQYKKQRWHKTDES